LVVKQARDKKSFCKKIKDGLEKKSCRYGDCSRAYPADEKFGMGYLSFLLNLY